MTGLARQAMRSHVRLVIAQVEVVGCLKLRYRGLPTLDAALSGWFSRWTSCSLVTHQVLDVSVVVGSAIALLYLHRRISLDPSKITSP